jgi:hypothetical protein
MSRSKYIPIRARIEWMRDAQCDCCGPGCSSSDLRDEQWTADTEVTS